MKITGFKAWIVRMALKMYGDDIIDIIKENLTDKTALRILVDFKDKIEDALATWHIKNGVDRQVQEVATKEIREERKKTLRKPGS